MMALPDVPSGARPIGGARWRHLRGRLGDRAYMVTVSAIDHAGNQSTRQVVVTVPHDQRGGGCPALPPDAFLGDGDPGCVFASPPIVPPPPETPPLCDVP